MYTPSNWDIDSSVRAYPRGISTSRRRSQWKQSASLPQVGQCFIDVTDRRGGITTSIKGCIQILQRQQVCRQYQRTQRFSPRFPINDTGNVSIGLASVVWSAWCGRKITRLGRQPVADISTLPPNYHLVFGKASATLSEQRSDLHPYFYRHGILCQQPSTGPHRQSAIAASLSSRSRLFDAGQLGTSQHARLMNMLFRRSSRTGSTEQLLLTFALHPLLPPRIGCRHQAVR